MFASRPFGSYSVRLALLAGMLLGCQSKTDPVADSPAPTDKMGSGSVVKTDAREAHHLVDAGASLIDVRTVEEYAEGHIDGSRNIPLADLNEKTDEIDSSQPVVVYCRSGRRSAQAAELLAGRGYVVHDLGAISSWED